MNYSFKNLALVLLVTLFSSCDEIDELTELRLTEDFSTTVTVNLPDDSMGLPQSISETTTISLTDSPEIEEYLNLIQDVTINSLTYEIDNYSVIENGTITEASVTFNGESIAVSDINLQDSDSNNIVYEIENTDLLTAIGNALENNNEISIGITGTVNGTPVQFDIIITLETTVTVDLV